MTAQQILRDRDPQGQDALRRGVAVVAVAQRLDRRLDDMLGRPEIGLADAEVDDVLALPLQLGRAGQHLEGRLGAEALQVRIEPQHPLLPCPGAPRAHVPFAAVI